MNSLVFCLYSRVDYLAKSVFSCVLVLGRIYMCLATRMTCIKRALLSFPCYLKHSGNLKPKTTYSYLTWWRHECSFLEFNNTLWFLLLVVNWTNLDSSSLHQCLSVSRHTKRKTKGWEFGRHPASWSILQLVSLDSTHNGSPMYIYLFKQITYTQNLQVNYNVSVQIKQTRLKIPPKMRWIKLIMESKQNWPRWARWPDFLGDQAE